MDLRYINRTDLVVIGACVLTLILFSINTMLDSIIPVYANAIIILGVFTYWSMGIDVTHMLRRSLIIGCIAGLSYTFIDNLFVEAGIIVYLRSEDVNIFLTPLSVVLTWSYSIAIIMYLYQRFHSFFSRFYIPVLLTGVNAFISSIILNELGDRARLWVWNIGTPSSPAVGSTPLFLPVALFVTFLFSPYIIGGQRITEHIAIQKNSVAAGLRCAIILSIMIFFSSRLLAR
jgi:preprotein translocase subunit Sec61beta